MPRFMIDTYFVQTQRGRRWYARRTLVRRYPGFSIYEELPAVTARFRTEAAARLAAERGRMRPVLTAVEPSPQPAWCRGRVSLNRPLQDDIRRERRGRAPNPIRAT